jgi:uncharacterized coiled-coil protein SlyX
MAGTLEKRISELEQDLRAKDRVIQELFDIIAQKDRALWDITQSAAWSLVNSLRRLRSVLAPHGTRREGIWRRLLNRRNPSRAGH